MFGGHPLYLLITKCVVESASQSSALQLALLQQHSTLQHSPVNTSETMQPGTATRFRTSKYPTPTYRTCSTTDGKSSGLIKEMWAKEVMYRQVSAHHLPA
jgi:hypothetical protein